MKLCKNVKDLEKKIVRFERLLWYTAGIMTLKFGGEALPMVAAMFG